MTPKAKARKQPKPRRKAPAKAARAEEEEKPLQPEVVEPEETEAVPEEEAGPGESALPVPVERDLARADALQRYMAEVAKHPLLSRDEEHRLAVEFAKTRDPELAYKLVTAN